MFQSKEKSKEQYLKESITTLRATWRDKDFQSESIELQLIWLRELDLLHESLKVERAENEVNF